MNYKSILLIMLAGFLASACSTPPVPDQTQEQAEDTASSSYTNCQNERMPDACSNVYASSGRVKSFNAYIYGQATENALRADVDVVQEASVDVGDDTLKAQKMAERMAEQQTIYSQAYIAYLRTASPEDLADMAAQWDKIAASAASTNATVAQ